MSPTPQFSIITISYNVGEALARTIASVNGQTHPSVEHVFIDGGSTDGSVDLIQRTARRAPRWVSERDRGISDAFNKGTRAARGAYVCYLNAGDVFAAPDVLARVAEHIAATGADDRTVYYGDFISIHHGVRRRHATSARSEDFAWENPINHQSAFLPRSLALAHPYDERITLGMDYDLWLRLLPVARFEKLSFPVAIFELGGRSSTPRWEVHGVVMRRVLWHLNRGSRFDTGDLVRLLARTARLKFKGATQRLLGPRLSRAIRAARSRRAEVPAPPAETRYA